MCNNNIFLGYFMPRFNQIKSCLTSDQVEAIEDADLSAEDMRKLLNHFIETDGYTEELDWLVSLTNPIVKQTYYPNPQMN